MTVPPGETTFSNQLRFQASDAAGNTVDELIPVDSRDGLLCGPRSPTADPLEAEPDRL